MPKLYDISVKTGTYVVNGQEKGRYENVGAVMTTNDGGKFILLKRTFNPAGVPDLSGRGGDQVVMSLFTPRDQDQSGSNQEQPPATAQQQERSHRTANSPAARDADFNDDIPF